MSSSFAYEDPLLRERTQAGMKTHQKAGAMFKEMGRGMWSTGKGFGKVGALYAGIECCIESARLLHRSSIHATYFSYSTVLKMTFTTQCLLVS